MQERQKAITVADGPKVLLSNNHIDQCPLADPATDSLENAGDALKVFQRDNWLGAARCSQLLILSLTSSAQGGWQMWWRPIF